MEFDLKHLGAAPAQLAETAADIKDLNRRVARLAERRRDAAGKNEPTDSIDEADTVLRAAVERARGALGGQRDLGAATLLARAAQYLFKAQGVPMEGARYSEAAGDELATVYLKAATAAHDTQLVIAPTIMGAVIEALAPASLFVRHVVLQEMPLGVNGVKLPRLDTGVTPGWVGEGGAVPVVAGATGNGVTLSVRKIGAIVVATNQLLNRSAFAPLLQRNILAKVAAALDTRFFASTTLTDAPDGILSAGSGTSVAATATTTAKGVAEDLSKLIETAVAAGVNLAQASFVFNPVTLGKLHAAADAAGGLPFAGAMQYAAIPFEISAGMPVGRVGLLAWPEIIGSTQGLPRIEVSQHGELHMNDAPNADALVPTTGGRSLFQTDSSALRVLMPAGWVSQHAVGACYVDAVNWD